MVMTHGDDTFREKRSGGRKETVDNLLKSRLSEFNMEPNLGHMRAKTVQYVKLST